MIKTTGCCLVRLILLGIMIGIIVGIVMYVAPAVKHDLEKSHLDRTRNRTTNTP